MRGNPNWTKGQSGNPAGKPKGIKNRETLAKEERRAIFEAEVSEMFLETIQKAKPEYLLDQFLGKAKDELNVNVEIKDDPEVKKLTETLNEIYRGTSK